MTLVVTPPAAITAAYNPVIVSATSNVRQDGTIGPVIGDAIDSVSNLNGYAQIAFISEHFLLKGDYIRITTAVGQPKLLGIALVTQIIDSSTIVITKPYTGNVTGTSYAYKYLNNYNARLAFYVYVNSAPTTPILAASKTIKPRFVAGFCYFEIDVSGLVTGFNYNDYTAKDVLSYDLYPLNGTGMQLDKKSFIKWGYELTEAFDNPVGGLPVYEPNEATE